MPCHPDRVRRHYMTTAVGPLTKSPQDMTQRISAIVSEMQIMDVAKSPQAMYDLARMTADAVFKGLVDGIKQRSNKRQL